jgi:hypothetical protein
MEFSPANALSARGSLYGIFFGVRPYLPLNNSFGFSLDESSFPLFILFDLFSMPLVLLL